jgi:hypothetical protein
MNYSLVYTDTNTWENIKKFEPSHYRYRDYASTETGKAVKPTICPTCSQVVHRPVAGANSPPPYEAGESKPDNSVGEVNEMHEGQVNSDDTLGLGLF